MADVAALVFDIDSSRARTAATDLAKVQQAAVGVANEWSKADSVLRRANGQFASSSEVVSRLGDEVYSLAAKYNPALRAVYDLQREEIRLARAVELGVNSKEEAARSLAKYSNELRKTIPELVALDRAQEESIRAAQAYAEKIESLKREFNPLYAASKQYEAQLDRLNLALDAGAINATQYQTALNSMNSGFAVGSKQVMAFGKSSEVATHHATNLGYQLNDIGMMMSLGQNPFALMMQQGPQVAQIFSTMNTEGKKIGPTLISAFTGMLNPTTLVTLALIGGSAALVQWGMSAFGASESTKTFSEKIDELGASVARVNEISKTYSADGLVQIRDKYGEINAELLLMLQRQNEFAVNDSMAKAVAAVTAIGDEYKGLNGQLDLYIKTGRGDMASLTAQLGLNKNQVIALGQSYRDALNAKSPKQMADAMVTVNAIIGKSSLTASNLANDVNEATLKMKELAQSAPNANWMSAAIAGVESLGESIRKRISEAMRLQAAANVSNSMTTGNANWTKTSLGFGLSGSELLSIPKPTGGGGGGSGGGGGGGGGAELKAAEKQFQNIRELLEKESVFQIAEWEKRQAQLDQALAKNMLSETTYQTMKQQLQMVYFGAEFEQKAVQYAMDQEQLQTALDGKLLTEQQYMMKRSELQHKYYSDAIGIDQNGTSQQLSQMSADFAQMNSLAGGGYDGLLKAQKAFAAGSALINAYLAASQAMADPSVPYWMKIAAYAKVLAAGMGAVNAIKGGGSGGASAGSTATASPTKQEPTKNIMVRLEGPDYMVDMAESIMQQIYEQSNSGRVIISRDR